MSNKTKILSDLSKIAVDAMSTFAGLKKEMETIVKLRVEKAINKLDLVKRDEFDNLKNIVQKLAKDRKNTKIKSKTSKSNLRKKNKKKSIKK
tara:strand:+ start:384 stop:659 length:276 start_codon:yes stop_codon:yes gene_type:complete